MMTSRCYYMKKSFIAKIIWVILIVLLVVGILALFFLPGLYNFFKEPTVPAFYKHSLFYKIAFYTCYLLGLGVISELQILFKSIFTKSPFCMEVERSLKVSAILFMILFLIVIIKALFIPTLLSFVVAIICLLASLSFYVLAEVIKAAIYYKKESDLTV